MNYIINIMKLNNKYIEKVQNGSLTYNHTLLANSRWTTEYPEVDLCKFISFIVLWQGSVRLSLGSYYGDF